MQPWKWKQTATHFFSTTNSKLTQRKLAMFKVPFTTSYDFCSSQNKTGSYGTMFWLITILIMDLSLWTFSVTLGLGCWWTAFVSLRGGVGRGMDSCRLSAVVCRKEYILHVTRKGNRYGSMSLPSVTGASHVHTDKRESGRQDSNTAPACYCPSGSWVNVGPLYNQTVLDVCSLANSSTVHRTNSAKGPDRPRKLRF